ncbi:MAG: sulfotransferase family protein, partial [Gemmataceae bacterium]
MNQFFIIGCPRSGTTMVQQALNRHSQIVIPPETKFFFSLFGHPRKAQHRHIDRLNADLQINLPKPVKALRSEAEGRAFYEEMAQQYLARVRKPNVTAFGEKTPEHTGHLPRIRQLFPEAKILVLYRDGRDVAASLSRMPWMSSHLYVNFLVWLYYHWVVQNEKQKSHANLYFARYEDIVAEPEKRLGAILQFLELPYESAVVEGCGNREGVPEREYAWKSRALRKINTERMGAFQQELSDEQIALLERLGREALLSLG